MSTFALEIKTPLIGEKYQTARKVLYLSFILINTTSALIITENNSLIIKQPNYIEGRNLRLVLKWTALKLLSLIFKLLMSVSHLTWNTMLKNRTEAND